MVIPSPIYLLEKFLEKIGDRLSSPKMCRHTLTWFVGRTSWRPILEADEKLLFMVATIRHPTIQKWWETLRNTWKEPWGCLGSIFSPKWAGHMSNDTDLHPSREVMKPGKYSQTAKGWRGCTHEQFNIIQHHSTSFNIIQHHSTSMNMDIWVGIIRNPYHWGIPHPRAWCHRQVHFVAPAPQEWFNGIWMHLAWAYHLESMISKPKSGTSCGHAKNHLDPQLPHHVQVLVASKTLKADGWNLENTWQT